MRSATSKASALMISVGFLVKFVFVRGARARMQLPFGHLATRDGNRLNRQAGSG